MKLTEQEFVPKKEIEFLKSNDREKIGNEYPMFNTCDHTLIDMSDLRTKDKKDWMHTLSIKLPNGNFATLCIMQCADHETCIDARFYGENIESHKVLGFKEGRTQSIKDQGTYALVLDAKEVL